MTEPIIQNPAQPILPLAELEPVMSEDQFCQWMVNAKPSDRIQIHVGHLMLDRSEPHLPYEPSERVRLNLLASRAWVAWEVALISLSTQRVGPLEHRYFAQRTDTPFREE
ncbi:MAG: hypothetical protein EBT04_09355 [Betaproteobacteria bacterium]|nr:hypothetical protein [Betaproteobacteria bacterium]